MKRFFNWCRRYISITSIVVVSFIAYTLFFQENSIFRFVEHRQTIDSLRIEIDRTSDSAAYYHRLNAMLQCDTMQMERVAREQYFMMRPGEDVYVFEP